MGFIAPPQIFARKLVCALAAGENQQHSQKLVVNNSTLRVEFPQPIEPPRRSTSDTPPTLPYRVKQAVKRQAKQLDAVLWRGSSFVSGVSYTQTSLRDYVASLHNRSLGGNTEGPGSAFLWVDPRTGSSYLLSCEHVIRNANGLAAIFQDIDQQFISIEDVEVVMADRRMDMALLSVNCVYKTGLKISLQELDEGFTEVWSVGFPALGPLAIFQMAKGYITNRSVGPFLQHDANIAPASSGCPLITAVKTVEGVSTTEFAVVGINSAVARERGNTFFAIPGPSLAGFIEQALKKQASPDDIWETEGNNSLDFATAIRLGAEVSGTLYPLNDEDWYRLDSPPDKPFDAVLAVNGNDLSVSLHNMNGELVQTTIIDSAVRFRAEGGPVLIHIKPTGKLFSVYSLKVLPL